MKKLHYFLVTGTIIFHTEAGEAGQISLNALVSNDNRNVPARLLGKAQQALQMHFFKKMNDATATVVDVVITNINHLGIMTEREFHAAPEGMVLQEKVSVADPFADPDPAPLTAAPAPEEVN